MWQRIPEGNPLPESVIRQAEELCRKHLIAFKLEALKREQLSSAGAEHLLLDLMCRRCEAERVNQVDVNSIVKFVHMRLPRANVAAASASASASEMRSELTPKLKKDECLFFFLKKNLRC